VATANWTGLPAADSVLAAILVQFVSPAPPTLGLPVYGSPRTATVAGAAGGVVPGAADAGVDSAGVYDDRYPVSAGPRVVAARYISAPATTATRMNRRCFD